MISFLISAYNIDVNPLLEALFQQASDLDIVFEVVIIDDCSTKELPEIKYWQEHKNIRRFKTDVNQGRSNIRNLLVEKAQYPWVILIDADTLPVSNDFVKNYIDFISTNPNEQVIFGGIAYDELDKNENNTLRYKYGINRESKSLKQRLQPHPYTSLLMSNTLIKKVVFDTVQFNSRITRYGHEDAVFAWDLYKNNIAITHIDNPLYHKGVESNEIFMMKTKEAIENLMLLYQQGIIDQNINKMLRYYEIVKKLSLVNGLARLYSNKHTKWERQLQSASPSLHLFDFYRLSYFCFIKRNFEHLKI